MRNNEPAFPEVWWDRDSTTGEVVPREQHAGMSLRSYLAAKFAAAWVIALAIRQHQTGYTDTEAGREANRLGVMQADAMLHELENTK